MKSLSIAKKMVAEKMAAVVYFTSYDPSNSEPTYYYLAIPGIKVPEFHKVLKHGYFNPEDHGVVLKWGYGNPDDGVKEEMWTQYGCKTD